MSTDTTFWRKLRTDFESLSLGEFTLLLVTDQLCTKGEPGKYHWGWVRFPDASLKARLGALALRGAKALGHDSEEAWYDELSRAEYFDPKWGFIDDVVKESITLCQKLETENEFQTPAVAARVQAERTESTDADSAGLGLPPTETEVKSKERKRGPKPDYETASRVAKVVAVVAPGGDWRLRPDAIREALDAEGIPIPKSWHKKDRTCMEWVDQEDWQLVRKAIEHRLTLAKKLK